MRNLNPIRRAAGLVALVVVVGLAGCTGDDNDGPTSAATASASTTSPAAAPTATPPSSPATTRPTDRPTSSSSAKPSATAGSGSSGGPGDWPAKCERETRSWNTQRESDNTYSAAEIYAVRVGTHDCYDRVVFSLNAITDIGYHADYVDVVRTDGQGQAIPVTGDADLQVIVRAWDFGYAQDGKQPWRKPWRAGQTLYNRDWPALRQVKPAGAHDGQTTFALGARSKLPFRVFVLVDYANQVTRVVVDIAHRA
jgi:hypothetical protein